MSDSNRTVFFIFLIVVAVMVFFLIIVGVVWGVNGVEGVKGILSLSGYFFIFLVVAAMFWLSVLLVGKISNNATANIVNFQAADDRGEVERMRVVREMVRGDREFSKDVRRLEMKAMSTKLPQPAQLTIDDEVDAEWWVAPSSFSEE